MNYAALIPMRAGSKRLPGKNTNLLNGISPARRAVDAAMGCGRIDHVYVATDDPEVHRQLRDTPDLRFFGRSPESCSDEAR